METHKNGGGYMWMSEAWEILVPRICFQKCILHRLIFSNLGRLTQHFYIWMIRKSRICLENKLLSLAFRPQSSTGGLDNWFGLAIYSNNLKCPSHFEFCRLSSSYTTSYITWWNRDHYSPVYLLWSHQQAMSTSGFHLNQETSQTHVVWTLTDTALHFLTPWTVAWEPVLRNRGV